MRVKLIADVSAYREAMLKAAMPTRRTSTDRAAVILLGLGITAGACCLAAAITGAIITLITLG